MRVLKVEYLKEHKLKITFSDKIIKVVDFDEKLKHAKGIFLPLKDIEYFKQVSVDDYCVSICWPNGADICPDVLYDMGRSIPRNRPKRKRVIKAAKILRRPKAKKRTALRS